MVVMSGKKQNLKLTTSQVDILTAFNETSLKTTNTKNNKISSAIFEA